MEERADQPEPPVVLEYGVPEARRPLVRPGGCFEAMGAVVVLGAIVLIVALGLGLLVIIGMRWF